MNSVGESWAGSFQHKKKNAHLSAVSLTKVRGVEKLNAIDRRLIDSNECFEQIQIRDQARTQGRDLLNDADDRLK